MDQKSTDNRFDGVWYDMMTGEFCRVVDMPDANTIGLVKLEREDDVPYFTFDEEGYSYEDAEDALEVDFKRVSEGAVNDPVAVVERMLSGDTENEYDFMYAREQVEIVEK